MDGVSTSTILSASVVKLSGVMVVLVDSTIQTYFPLKKNKLLSPILLFYISVFNV